MSCGQRLKKVWLTKAIIMSRTVLYSYLAIRQCNT